MRHFFSRFLKPLPVRRRRLRLETLERRNLLASYIVTTSVDENDIAPIVGAGLSLREAVGQANVNPGADNISFASAINGTQIDLLATLGQLQISETVTIASSGASSTIVNAGQQGFRVFDVTAGDATITGLTITGGQAPANESGGGIRFAAGAAAKLTIRNSTLSGNTAFGGGGLYNNGKATLTSSTLSGNSAVNGGGALFNAYGSTATLSSSTLSGNSAGYGGGLYNNGGTVTLTNSTLSSNSASLKGGGLYNTSASTVTLTNSTLSNNSADGSGGGLFNNGTATLNNTIVAGSTLGGDITGPVNVIGQHNLIGDPSFAGGLTNGTASNIVGQDNGAGGRTLLDIATVLLPLAFNGGLAQTHALITGSPAINAGDNTLAIDAGSSTALTNDQRGTPFVRVFNNTVDIGAYESQTLNPSLLVVNTTVDELDYSNTTISLREAINSANGSLGADTITFSSAVFATPQTLLLASGQLLINGSVTIAPSQFITIDAQARSRVFDIPDGDVSLTNLGITSGFTSGNFESGGGIRFQSAGTLTLNNSQVTGNVTFGTASPGGGIYAYGNLVLSGSTVANNITADQYSEGGGIASPVHGNITLTNSTLSGNYVIGDTQFGGGGLYFDDGTLTIDNSTITGNSANIGGGIGVNADNNDESITIRNSIVAGNFATTNPEFTAPGTPVTNLTVSFSLIGDNTGTTLTTAPTADGNGNLIGGSGASAIDPKLGPLQNNGGTTLTHAPLMGSPAIDAAKGSLAPTVSSTDQRGVARKIDLPGLANATGGDATDIGAVEVVGISIAAASAIENASSLSFTVTLSNAIPFGQSVTARFDTANITGQAIAGSDYTAVSNGTVTFAFGGSLTQLVNVPLLNDTLAENNENFIGALSNAVGAIITTATAFGTILDDDTTLSIAATSAVKAEGTSGNTPFTFTVTRAGNLSIVSSATYTVTGHSTSSVNTIDLGGIVPTGTVTFAANESSKVITINVTGDTTVELDESFRISLTNPSAGTAILATSGYAIGTLLNDDTSYATAATSAVKAEGDSGTTPFTFTVTRSGLTTSSSTVKYAVTSSSTTGAAAADFSGNVLPTGTVTFAAGVTSQLITINVLGETVGEQNEGFIVTLNTPSSLGTITTATATGTIQNDDALLAIVATSAVKAEGNSGNTPFTFTVTRSGNLNLASSATYTVTGSSTTPISTTDVGGSVPTGTVSFAIGESSKVITINVTGDTAVEPDESFRITLTNPSAGTTILATSSTAIGTLLNDDTSYAIAATSAVKAEGDDRPTPFSFIVTRSGLTTGSSTVKYAVTGSATNGAAATDFLGNVLPSGTVTFAAGETSRPVTINVLGDTVGEQNEGFIVTLNTPSSPGTITTATASGTIQNDDALLSIVATSAVKAEGNSGNTPFTFTVTRSGNLNLASSATYTVTGSSTTPISTTDVGGFVPTGTVSFAVGESSKVITINVTGDTTVEPDESFRITLTNPSAGTTILATSSTAIGTLLNDDTAYAIAATSAAKPEGNSGLTPFTFTVTRSGLTTGSGTVKVAVTGSASNGANAADFSENALPSGTVLFAAGVTSQLVTINVLSDTVVELSEGFIVTLNTPGGTSTIITAIANGTIQNDD